ncbi:CAP domain-containing protein [Tropicimonas sp. IMCC34043]|uniref:CAP domain-containing protein n=1 Tax=Tropicimonas sp. IMCC34043 TaxID=2248760 RepID=UPI000E25B2B3|nr:CAP domain-containing protein [Tropicimonas sp. IMCC34043]
MTRLIAILSALTLTLAACGSPGGGGSGNYRISRGDAARIPGRVLEQANGSRTAAGLQPMTLSSELSAAAMAHSRDMSYQNRPWHWGSDGSSPIQRVARAGYSGKFMGENVSESFEDEITTLNAWMNESDTRSVIMDPEATEMGFGWHQDANSKIWWTLVTGAPIYGTSMTAAYEATGF